MDFGFSEEEERFRQEVREFLEEEIRKGTFVPTPYAWAEGHNQEFTNKLAQKGWIGIHWPKEYGGQGRSEVERIIFWEEMCRYGAPTGLHYQAENHFAASIIYQGSEEQKKELLAKVRKGELTLAMLATEPDGHPVDESLKTRAVVDGDDVVINGEKVWSTNAPSCNLYQLLAVVDPKADPRERIKRINVDPNTPGVTMRPIKILSGHETFGQEWFDDVRVPKKNILPGPVTKEQARRLPTEHAQLWRIMAGYCLWEATIEFVKETERDGRPLSQDPLIRSKVAQIEIEREIGRLFNYRIGIDMDNDADLYSSGEVMVLKAYGAEFQQHQAETIMEIVGLYGQMTPAPQLGPVLETAGTNYLYSLTAPLRSFPLDGLWSRIAMEGLGLPNYLEPPRYTT